MYLLEWGSVNSLLVLVRGVVLMSSNFYERGQFRVNGQRIAI
jgi:hypothetical protein